MTTRPASEQAFRTYANYLRAWCLAAEHFGTSRPSFVFNADAQVQLAPDRRAQLSDSLSRYWGNLRALDILNSDRMAAEVLFVHPPIAYYAVHNASRATLWALGQTPSDNHDGVLSQMAQVCRTQQLPKPWCSIAIGAPRDHDVRNLGTFEWPSSNLGLVTAPRALGFVGMSLTTTRKDIVELALERQRRGRRRAGRGARQKKEQSVHPTTVFDLLYRYRRVAHYGKSDNFMQFETEDQAIDFGLDLLFVTDTLTKTLELLIQRRVGSDLLEGLYETYIGQNGITEGDGPLGRRLLDLRAPF